LETEPDTDIVSEIQ